MTLIPLRFACLVLTLAFLIALASPLRAQPIDSGGIDKLLDMVKEKKKIAPKDDDDELRKLLIQRYNVSLDELTSRCDDFKKSLTSQDKVVQAAQDHLAAELALQEKPEDRAAILERSINLLKWYEARQEKALKDGVGLRADLYRTQYVRLSMEIDLAKAKKEMKGK